MLTIVPSNGESLRQQRVWGLQHRVRVVWAVPRANSKPRHARHGTVKCSAYGGGGESSGDTSSADDGTRTSTRRGSRTTLRARVAGRSVQVLGAFHTGETVCLW